MNNCVLISGPVDGGKTTLLRKMIRDKRRENHSVGGIVAAPLYRNGKKAGYDVLNILTGEMVPLVRPWDRYADPFPGGSQRVGRFLVLGEGLKYGVISVSEAVDANILCVDEIGPLEAGGGGYREILDHLLKEYKGTLWIVVRNETLQWLIARCEENEWTVSCVEPQKKIGQGIPGGTESTVTG